jgi:hypothetical protein
MDDGVETINNGVFRDCTALKDVKLSGTLKLVQGFEGCTALETIVLPPQVDTIGKDAFSGCSSLKSIDLPASVTLIGSGAFCYCSLITAVILPPAIRKIDNNAFAETGIKNVMLPKSLVELSSLAFENLDAIAVEEGNPQFDSRGGCNAVIESGKNKLIVGTNNTVIPDTVTEIDGFSFKNCKGLKNITIPASVTQISWSAFQGTGLTSVIVPETVTELGSSAFQDCESLTEATVKCSLEEMEYTFQGCSKLEKVTLPAKVKTMDSVFYKCASLKVINVPAKKGAYYRKRLEDDGKEDLVVELPAEKKAASKRK